LLTWHVHSYARGQRWDDGAALRAAALEAVSRAADREAVRLAMTLDGLTLLADGVTLGPPVPSGNLGRVRDRLDAARAVQRDAIRARRRRQRIGASRLRRVK